MKKKSVIILALAAACLLLSACQKESKDAVGPNSAVNGANNNNSAVEVQPNNEQPEKDGLGAEPGTEIGTEKLFDLQEYDGSQEITLEWGGQQTLARFNKDPFMPFGLYVPEQMEVYEFEDGNRWGYDGDKHYISINKYDEIFLPDLTLQNKELQKYEEYVGSKQEGTVNTDSFVMEKDDKKYFVNFVYFDTEQAKALPMFQEVARNIRYVTK